MIGVPDRTEAAPYHFAYIDRIQDPNIVEVLERQLHDTTALLQRISEEQSLHRYAPEKWSIREAWNHVNDTERVFAFRAFWFARGYETPLPGFDQEIGARAAHADAIPWVRHVEEFGHIRRATLAFFRNLPLAAWHRRGAASGHEITVRALAYVTAGHVAHHVTILREQYLTAA